MGLSDWPACLRRHRLRGLVIVGRSLRSEKGRNVEFMMSQFARCGVVYLTLLGLGCTSQPSGEVPNPRFDAQIAEADRRSQVSNQLMEEQQASVQRAKELISEQDGQLQRMAKLLDKMEEQARRKDVILDAEEKQLGIKK
jgi:hypothetical protein